MVVATIAVMAGGLGHADLCGISEDAQVVGTVRAIAWPEYLDEAFTQRGHWGIVSAKRIEGRSRTEKDQWNRAFGGQHSLPDSPYCRYPRIELRFGHVQELRVYRLRGRDLPTISAGELLDFYAGGVLRERDGRENYVLLGDAADWSEESATAQAGPEGHAPSSADDEEHYLVVATSPPPGFNFDPGAQGQFGSGWHTESHHDAGMTAVDECRRQGGGNCSFNASGTSLRGGCVGLAMATWRDRDMEEERTYVVTSSTFRDVIAGDLRSACESHIFGGKHEDTVVEHSCEVVRIICAGDTIPAVVTPTPAS